MISLKNSDQFHSDKEKTLFNRERLIHNRNLMFWYERLYRSIFRNMEDIMKLNILEIGSGTSPLKRFYPSVTTSDILDMEHLDIIFDCHDIDKVKKFKDCSIDVITMTNVIHHLQKPILFLEKAAIKLKPGGKIIITEPYFSIFSYPIFKFIHHEPTDFSIEKPELASVEGPLSSANQALPHMIFFSRKAFIKRLSRIYSIKSVKPFTFISYFLTGGISHNSYIPNVLYRTVFELDLFLSLLMRKLFCSFATVILVKN